VYVYRDTGGQPADPAAGSPGQDPAERDAAYWYDVLAEDPAPKLEEIRGPFEPLVSSAGPPPGAVHEPDLDQTADARARKLEQIRDLYLTAEAIGEQNVDKHFDQLLAQQRELISDYFRQSAAAQAAAAQPVATSPGDGLAAGADAEADAGADAEEEARDERGPGGPRVAGGLAGAPEGAGVAAEPPRAW
jgi:hypothetical protein